MKRESNTQLIIKALLTGNALKTKDIAKITFETSQRNINPNQIASILKKISNKDKCELGYFIERKRQGYGFTYQIAKEALVLSEKQAYELSLKNRKNSYNLEKAFLEYPKLEHYIKYYYKYIEHSNKLTKNKNLNLASNKSIFQKLVNKSPFQYNYETKNVDIFINYLDKYKMSFSLSNYSLAIFALAIIIMFSSCLYFIYLFLFHIILIFSITGITFLFLFIRKMKKSTL